jgi:hypothetical protein
VGALALAAAARGVYPRLAFDVTTRHSENKE